jgi:hypothetical protein
MGERNLPEDLHYIEHIGRSLQDDNMGVLTMEKYKKPLFIVAMLVGKYASSTLQS